MEIIDLKHHRRPGMFGSWIFRAERFEFFGDLLIFGRAVWI